MDDYFYVLPGSYGEEYMPMVLRPTLDSDVIVLFVHGAHGVSAHTKVCYSEWFDENNRLPFHVVSYRSSRNQGALEGDPLYEERLKLFGKKGISQELRDLRAVLCTLEMYSRKRFGRDFRDMKLLLIGESLGGMLSVLVAYDMPEIKGIVAIGTGDELEANGNHLLKSYPKRNLVERRAGKFKGEFVLHVAGDDEVFTRESSERLFEAVGSKNKKMILHEGVEHRFIKKNGVLSTEPMELVNQQVMKMAMGMVAEGVKERRYHLS